MDKFSTTKQANIVVQGVEYILSIQASDDELYNIDLQISNVDLESKYDSQIWRNKYARTYIEELTQKTGSFKKFSTFVQMLCSGISNTSEQINIEILTYQDLESMKQMKMQQSGQSFKSSTSSSSSSSQIKLNKRYIIMAYNSEFDKVHYPLPLNYEENADSAKLQSTIQKLKGEQELAKNGRVSNIEDFGTHDSLNKSKDIQSGLSRTSVGLNEQIREENEILKAKLRRLEEASNQKIGAIEMDNIIRDKHSLQHEVDQLRQQMSKDNQKFLSDLLEKNKELVLRNAEISAFKKELTNLIGREDADKNIQRYIQSMNQDEESQLQLVKRNTMKLEKEVERLIQEVDQSKKLDQKQKQRIKQLEVELETSMKKFSHKGITDRLYSPFSNQSNGSKKSNNTVPNNKVSPNSSKNSFNSRNSSNKSYNNSPGSNRAPNSFMRKPQSGAQMQKTAPPRVAQPQIKVQSATVRGVVNRYSPVVSRQPTMRQNLAQRSPIPQNKPQTYDNRKPQQNTSASRQPYNQRISPQRNNQSPVQGRAPQRYSVPAQQRIENDRGPIKPEFNDNHFNSNKAQQPQANYLDNKINNLRNLLQQAKK